MPFLLYLSSCCPQPILHTECRTLFCLPSTCTILLPEKSSSLYSLTYSLPYTVVPTIFYIVFFSVFLTLFHNVFFILPVQSYILDRLYNSLSQVFNTIVFCAVFFLSSHFSPIYRLSYSPLYQRFHYPSLPFFNIVFFAIVEIAVIPFLQLS